MINHITWASYLSAVTILLLLYYSVILLLFYRKDFRFVLHRIVAPKPSPQNKENVEFSHQQSPIGEIRAFVRQAACNISKAELIFGLQQLLSRYKHLQNTAYETSINQLILHECACCNVHLYKEDVDQLWVV